MAAGKKHRGKAGSEERKEPFVSIIMSVYNGGKVFDECLESLSKISYKNYELVIVNDNSKDNTLEIAENFRKKRKIPKMKIITNKKNLNVGGARNAGIRNADGNIIVITDADCEFPKGWLGNLIRPIVRGDADVVGGPDQAPKNDRFFARCVDYALTSFIGTGGMRRGGNVRIAKYYPRGCNIAFPKKVFKDVGEFDERIVPGEEIEWDCRAKKKGYRLGYSPDAVVLHKRRPKLFKFCKHTYGRGYYRVIMGRKHRELLEPLHVMPAMLFVFGILMAIGSIFSSTILRIFLVLAGIYLAALMLSGLHAIFKTRNPLAFFVVPTVIFLQHTLYGAGFVKSLFDIALNALKKERSR